MSQKAVDFTEIIPAMREEITKYIKTKVDQGQIITEREAILAWLDRYYDDWLAVRMGDEKPSHASVSDSDEDVASRRKSKRIPIELSAFYRVLWTPPIPSEEEGEELTDRENEPSKEAEVQNISAGGLYIVTGRDYPISTLMEVEFELPTVPESITAFAMVCWKEERGPDRFGHGLHFSHIETMNVGMINEAIIERLLDAPVVVTEK